MREPEVTGTINTSTHWAVIPVTPTCPCPQGCFGDPVPGWSSIQPGTGPVNCRQCQYVISAFIGAKLQHTPMALCRGKGVATSSLPQLT